ncbi:MAG TPA: hypothetical protein VKA50_13015 [Gammaproteobacteria bacterium]|nr:hypothetical protein [Gammaproteobacteria bacterium]
MKKRRKPDLILLLAIIIGLGVLVTGFTQESSHRSDQVVRAAQR